jgi:nucleolar protein 4
MARSGDKKRQREAEDQPLVQSEPDNHHEDPPTKKARVEARHSLFVRSLPANATSESLTEFFSQHYPVKHAIVVVDPKTKASRGYGFVTFTDADDTVEAKEKLNNQLLDGSRLRLEIAEPRTRDATKTGSSTVQSKVAEEKRMRQETLAEARKAPKLIIRNLPWSVKTPAQLEALFRSYGKVKFADLPRPKGMLAGFGFVTLRGRKNAEKALEEVNGKVVDGRTLAVDWAVDKETWEQQKDEDSEPEKPEAAGSDEDEAENQEDDDIANFMKNHMGNLEDEDEDDEDDEGEDVSGNEDDEDQEGDEEQKEVKPLMTDNSTTIFIRNLPFQTTDEQLKTHFTQFGPVRYARVVMDRATDRPAGTGFVCFVNGEDCKTCLIGAPRHQPTTTLGKRSVLQDETVDQDGRYTLEGRVLQLAQAVSKDEATRLASDGPGGRNRQDKDRRRLYLLSEGTISNNSSLFRLLAPAEVKMRAASEKQRKKLIESNPSLHLSLTRLALRNIPRDLTSKELKALAREAVVGFAKDVKEGRREVLSKEEIARGGQQDKEAEHQRKEKGKGVVRQAKIVFESKEGSKVAEEVGGGKSRGYGFIEYSSHRWALMGLRWLNGHALNNEAGKSQRLIVEFAIENANVIQRRKALAEKSRSHEKAAADSNPRAGQSKKYQKGGKDKPSKDKVKEKTNQSEDGDKTKSADSKLALRTKIIARKRMLRKKKATARRTK